MSMNVFLKILQFLIFFTNAPYASSLDASSDVNVPQDINVKRRLEIMHPKGFTPFIFEPKPKELFFNFVKEAFQMINTPYESRRDGVFYRENYIVEPHSVEEERNIDWCANVHYFDISMQGGFIVKEGVSAAEALQAFFKGPTIADCTTVMQAAYFWGILNILGSKEFDNKFCSPSCPLYFNVKFNGEGKTDREKFLATPSIVFSFMETLSLTILLSEGLKIGDHLYVKGHPLYAKKHPAGSGAGWNVVLVDYNELGLPLFTAFSPIKFGTPKTYSEIIKFLIDSFNEPLSEFDKAEKGDPLDGVVAKKEDIVGLNCLIRFNVQKLI